MLTLETQWYGLEPSRLVATQLDGANRILLRLAATVNRAPISNNGLTRQRESEEQNLASRFLVIHQHRS